MSGMMLRFGNWCSVSLESVDRSLSSMLCLVIYILEDGEHVS